MNLDLFGLLTGFLKEPGGWICLLLFVAIVWLVAVVAGLRQEVTLLKQESAHYVKPPFLTQFSNNSNRRQLRRIRNAARATAKELDTLPHDTSAPAATAAAMRRFERRIQAEIATLEPGRFDGDDDQHHDDEDDFEDEPSSAVSSGPDEPLDPSPPRHHHSNKAPVDQAFDEVGDADDDPADAR